MKSSLVGFVVKNKYINKYPYVGIHNFINMYVLFTKKESGFVLFSGTSDNEIGYCSDQWVEEDFILINKCTITFEV